MHHERHGIRLRYRRLLLKLSGEALMGKGAYGIDMAVVQRLAGEIKEVIAAGAEIAIVVGGGNIFRGLAGAAKGMDRATADYMGMLATVMNALALQNALEQLEVPARVHVRHPDADRVRSLRALQGAASSGMQARRDLRGRHRQSVLHHRHDGGAARDRDELRSAGQGNAGGWRLFGRSQEGSQRMRYDRLTYSEVLARDLKVMDGAAIALARDNDLPVIVFSIEEPGNLLKVLRGEARATVIEGSA